MDYEQQQSFWNNIVTAATEKWEESCRSSRKITSKFSDNKYLDIKFTFDFMNHSNTLLFNLFNRRTARLRLFIFCQVKRIRCLQAHYASR